MCRGTLINGTVLLVGGNSKKNYSLSKQFISCASIKLEILTTQIANNSESKALNYTSCILSSPPAPIKTLKYQPWYS